MAIRLNIPPLLQTLTNYVNVAQVSGGTVGECLEELVQQFPGLETELFDVHGDVLYQGLLFSVNGEVAYLDAAILGKPVKDGDELSIIPIVSDG